MFRSILPQTVLSPLLLLLLLPSPSVAGSLSTFTLPTPAPGNGIYYPDLAASFPDVDWQTLDRLYLPAGHFRFVRLGGLPERSAASPLVITNHGGQVRVGGLGHYYTFVIGGGSHWRLTGRYDAAAGTGDAGFLGHDGGYAHSRDTYGILLDDGFGSGGSCLGVGGGATAFEIDFLEIRECGFAGMLIKTDDDGDATMDQVRIHDNYIHDVSAEGLYVGSTQAEPQHSFTDFKLYNNRVIRTGAEALQLGQLGDGSEIHNNVFLLGALEWKRPFQAFQDNASQYGGRFGNISVHHNIVIGGASNLMIFFGQDRTGDPHDAGHTQRIEDNFFSHGRNLGVYVHSQGDGVSTYRFARNSFRNIDFQYDELNPSATDPNAVLRIFNTANPIELVDNRWQGPQVFAQVTGGAQVIQSGNTQEVIEPPRFVDSGFAADFDYLRVERWTDVDSSGLAVTYGVDDYVMHLGELYRATASNQGQDPSSSPDVWQLQPLPADDVRLHLDSPLQGVGLLDNVHNFLLFRDGFESGNTAAWSGGL